MKDQHFEEQSLHKAILHQTKQKYKELKSSLLLTSSLMSHKQKISQLRKQNIPSLAPHSCKGILKTSKMNLQEGKCSQQQAQGSMSNIQELKFLAKKLQQQQMTKLGKQNQKEQETQRQAIIAISQTQVAINRGNPKKMNKRKIVKGRPSVYVYTKKRKILKAIMEQNKEQQLQSAKGDFRETINDLLNKNKLLKLITTKNITGSNNLYQNFVRQKRQQFLESLQSPILANERRSSVSFKNYDKTTYATRLKTKQLQECRDRVSIRHFSLGHKRYSVSQTIQ